MNENVKEVSKFIFDGMMKGRFGNKDFIVKGELPLTDYEKDFTNVVNVSSMFHGDLYQVWYLDGHYIDFVNPLYSYWFPREFFRK